MGAALTAACARRMDTALSRLARALFAAIIGLPLLASEVAAAPHAVVLEIDGAIGPAVADYVVRELRGVSRDNTRLVVLRMNTPGGLDTSMREIIRAILASPVPVVTYVAPSGARAASAGTYIAYASAIAAMAPGTNLGAATPIQLGGTPGLPGGTQPAGQKDKEKRGEGSSNSSEPADAETPQGRQRRGRLHPRPRRAQRPQRRLGDRSGALGGEPSGIRGAQASRHRRDRRRRAGSASQDRWPHRQRRRQARTPGNRGSRDRERKAGLADRAARRHHRSQRRFHSDAASGSTD